MENNINEKYTLPLIPLRGLTIFPGMLLTFEVERDSSVTALNNAVNKERLIFLSSQIIRKISTVSGVSIHYQSTCCNLPVKTAKTCRHPTRYIMPCFFN